jgi:uncharacterized damage-inducible protein DinB
MLTVADVRRLFAYNRRVLDEYLKALGRLPWKTVTRNRGVGHHSMKDTFLHILQVHEIWHRYVVPGRMKEVSNRTDPYKLQSWKAIRLYADEVWRAIDRELDRLTENKLRARVKAPWMPGRYTVEDACLQTTFEQAHHLGELIALFWQRDWEPPEMTWIMTQNKILRRRSGG